MHEGAVDAHQAQNDFEDEGDIEHHVRQTVRNEALALCGRGHCCCNLSDNQRPIVDGLTHGDCVLLLVRVRPCALVVPDVHQPGHLEEHKPAEERLQNANVAVGVHSDSPVRQLDEPRVPRRPGHELGLGGLECICDRRPNVGADVDQQHLRDGQRLRDTEYHSDRRAELRDLGAESVHDGLAQVRTAQTALLNAVDNRGEVIVLQHDVRGVLRDLSATDAHRNANLRLLQRRRVIYSIACHRTDIADAIVAILLVGLHDDLLVNRRHPCEDPRVLRGLLPPLYNLRGLVICEVVRLGHTALEHYARDHREVLGAMQLVALKVILAMKNIDTLGDGARCVRVVTCDHNDLDAGTLRL
mmetsp:Transcript_100406/g.289993  ORF Transcript_100406/g.289993 Transcript_100406/m.289993 type:complete len:357 (+) Transcript_100406:413-1483(+)